MSVSIEIDIIQRLYLIKNQPKRDIKKRILLPQVLHTMRGELDALKREVRLRQGSEEQMKQVLAEYEKTISELIAEKEKEQQKFNDEKVRLVAERDQVRQVQGW